MLLGGGGGGGGGRRGGGDEKLEIELNITVGEDKMIPITPLKRSFLSLRVPTWSFELSSFCMLL